MTCWSQKSIWYHKPLYFFFWQKWKNTVLEAGFIAFWKINLKNGFNLFKLKKIYLQVTLFHVEYRKDQF